MLKSNLALQFKAFLRWFGLNWVAEFQTLSETEKKTTYDVFKDDCKSAEDVIKEVLKNMKD